MKADDNGCSYTAEMRADLDEEAGALWKRTWVRLLERGDWDDAYGVLQRRRRATARETSD